MLYRFLQKTCDVAWRNKLLVVIPILFTIALLAVVAYLSTGPNAFVSHVYVGN